MTLNNDMKLRAKGNIPVTEIGGEIAMLDASSGKYYMLNDVGSFLWKSLDTTNHIEALVRMVMDHYEVDEATCQKDVDHYLNKMITIGLIEIEA